MLLRPNKTSKPTPARQQMIKRLQDAGWKDGEDLIQSWGRMLDRDVSLPTCLHLDALTDTLCTPSPRSKGGWSPTNSQATDQTLHLPRQTPNKVQVGKDSQGPIREVAIAVVAVVLEAEVRIEERISVSKGMIERCVRACSLEQAFSYTRTVAHRWRVSH